MSEREVNPSGVKSGRAKALFSVGSQSVQIVSNLPTLCLSNAVIDIFRTVRSWSLVLV